jgi:hypothetical protein
MNVFQNLEAIRYIQVDIIHTIIRLLKNLRYENALITLQIEAYSNRLEHNGANKIT